MVKRKKKGGASEEQLAEAKQRAEAPLPEGVKAPPTKEQLGKIDDVIGKLKVGGVEFTGYGSVIKTVQHVTIDHKVPVLIGVYAKLTGDDRPNVDPEQVKDVVKGAVQNAWYVFNKQEVPERCLKNQEERVKKAAKSTASAEKPAKEKKAKAPKKEKTTTAPVQPAANAEERIKQIVEGEKPKTKKALIDYYLLKGTSEDKVIEKVQKDLPEHKVQRKDIVWRRNELIRDGLLEQGDGARAPRTKKAEAAAGASHDDSVSSDEGDQTEGAGTPPAEGTKTGRVKAGAKSNTPKEQPKKAAPAELAKPAAKKAAPAKKAVKKSGGKK